MQDDLMCQFVMPYVSSTVQTDATHCMVMSCNTVLFSNYGRPA